MSANELIAEIKALPESERDRVYRLLLADLELHRARQLPAAATPQPAGSVRPLAKLAAAVADWRFPEALPLGQPAAPVEDWRLLANEPGV